MKPYRVRLINTSLYYKPGKENLSRKGKTYQTKHNILNHIKNEDYVYIVIRKIYLTRYLDGQGYKIKWFKCDGSEVCFEIPKSEFEIEYLPDVRRKKG